MVLYYMRVFFISFEFLSILMAFAFYCFFGAELDAFWRNVSPNEKALEWLFLYPVAVAVWVVKEGANVLFPSERANAILHGWPDYWRLRAHFNVGVIYCVGLAVPCVFMWLVNGLSSSKGMLTFLACALASSVSALSFFQANLRLKEILIRIE